MSKTVVMPAMIAGQSASWHGLLDLYERRPTGWTLVGGQMVHLHCAERGHDPQRPTDDVDAVLDVRENPTVLLDVTSALVDLDFHADKPTADGVQHRWRRQDAQIDLLVPAGVGERAARRVGVTGSRTIETPGGIQALRRTEVVEVRVGERVGHVRRPDLLGALLMKAAAHTVPGDGARKRHLGDFAVLAGMIAAGDLREDSLSRTEVKRLRAMVASVREDPRTTDRERDAVGRLVRAARLD